jgi:thermostable 8-oxoguanine DNA glycosylase
MQSDTKDYDVFIVEKAFEFLLSFKNVNKEILCKQLSEGEKINIDSLDEVFYRLMVSLQNANMKANIIGGSIEKSGYENGIEALRREVIPNLKKMGEFKNTEDLLREIFTILQPSSKYSLKIHIENSTSIWHKYIKSLFSAKAFLDQFEDFEDFKKWVEFFDGDDRARSALPMILSREIYGLGFALACDFLKEIGYINFGKPDVHIKDIFYQLGLSRTKDDYFVLKDIARIAKNNNKSAYYIDKLFWLIGSGNFYLSNITIGRQKDDFISKVKDTWRGGSQIGQRIDLYHD